MSFLSLENVSDQISKKVPFQYIYIPSNKTLQQNTSKLCHYSLYQNNVALTIGKFLFKIGSNFTVMHENFFCLMHAFMFYMLATLLLHTSHICCYISCSITMQKSKESISAGQQTVKSLAGGFAYYATHIHHYKQLHGRSLKVLSQ